MNEVTKRQRYHNVHQVAGVIFDAAMGNYPCHTGRYERPNFIVFMWRGVRELVRFWRRMGEQRPSTLRAAEAKSIEAAAREANKKWRAEVAAARAARQSERELMLEKVSEVMEHSPLEGQEYIQPGWFKPIENEWRERGMTLDRLVELAGDHTVGAVVLHVHMACLNTQPIEDFQRDYAEAHLKASCRDHPAPRLAAGN